VADPAARIPNIATTSTYSLVGTLELGDPSRSAALFVINGTTQRVQVGEAIGSSGWALVSVKGDEAIVRRNGEVRSITTGQRF
jgi:Tfp pilus assembly protein PilP